MDQQNFGRIRAIMGLFGLSVTEVAKAGGVSRPYLSQALSGTLAPSPGFYMYLESSLWRLGERRSGQVFSVLVTQADVEVRQIPQD
jgi:transcriptional regulator with XRE-family HTH domain